MASPGSIVIQFRANTKSAVKDIEKLTDKLSKVGKQSKTTGQKLKKGLAIGAAAVGTAMLGAGAALVDFGERAIADAAAQARLAKTTGEKMKKGLAIGAAAVGTAMLGAGAALVDFGERAIADAAAQARLAKTLKNTTKATDAQVASVEDWITQQGIALGVADDDLRPALARLARSTEDVTKAQELAGIAMDIAASTGKPLATVADALAKAYDGNTGALKRMGIVLDDGPGKWKTLADSVKGSADSQASSIEGTWTRVKLIFSEGAEALGGVVLAPLERFAKWLEDPANVGKVKTYLDNAAKGAYEAGEAFVAWIDGTILPAIQTVYDYFASPKGQAQIKSWGDAFLSTADAVQAFISKLDTLFKLLDKLPGNIVLQKLGLIPKLSDLTSGGKNQPVATREGVREAALRTSRQEQRARDVASARPSTAVTVNVYNPKTEKAADSAAMAIRLAKTVGY